MNLRMNLLHNNTSWDLQLVNKRIIVFFLLQLQLQVHVNDCVIVKDIMMPCGIMALWL
jgi:hypothetical protein